MRRSWACILTLALLMTLVGADVASAKKSRRASSRTNARRDSRKGRASAATSHQKRGKNLAVRGKRGRHLARRRGRRSEAQVIVAPGVPRPAPGIPAERVTEIQNALIKAGFLDGPASGLYDDDTIDAVKQYQAQNGMSQTGLPSAPLLKRLGVPKRSNDGYAVPVNSVSETEKKRPATEKP